MFTLTVGSIDGERQKETLLEIKGGKFLTVLLRRANSTYTNAYISAKTGCVKFDN